MDFNLLTWYLGLMLFGYLCCMIGFALIDVLYLFN